MSKPNYPTLTNARITSGFGLRNHPLSNTQKFHFGTDFAPFKAGTTGVPVYAVRNGRVSEVFNRKPQGKTIRIKHDSENVSTGYQHLARIDVKQGDRVKQGQLIGIMGTTGDSSGIHLHFEVTNGSFNFVRGNYRDPIAYLKKDTGTAKPAANVSTNGLQWFATEVKKGTFGNGHPNRQSRIYALVRNRVNGKGKAGAFEDVVADVKKGVYGNGHTTRAERIYKEVVKIVNR